MTKRASRLAKSFVPTGCFEIIRFVHLQFYETLLYEMRTYSLSGIKIIAFAVVHCSVLQAYRVIAPYNTECSLSLLI